MYILSHFGKHNNVNANTIWDFYFLEVFMKLLLLLLLLSLLLLLLLLSSLLTSLLLHNYYNMLLHYIILYCIIYLLLSLLFLILLLLILLLLLLLLMGIKNTLTIVLQEANKGKPIKMETTINKKIQDTNWGGLNSLREVWRSPSLPAKNFWWLLWCWGKVTKIKSFRQKNS